MVNNTIKKYQGKPFEFNQTAHFDHLKESLDLIDLSEINVEGQLTVKSNEVIADMHVTGTYTMPCARTLVPVEVPLDVTTSEVFDLEAIMIISIVKNKKMNIIILFPTV